MAITVQEVAVMKNAIQFQKHEKLTCPECLGASNLVKGECTIIAGTCATQMCV